jgi:hypothetical protein
MDRLCGTHAAVSAQISVQAGCRSWGQGASSDGLSVMLLTLTERVPLVFTVMLRAVYDDWANAHPSHAKREPLPLPDDSEAYQTVFHRPPNLPSAIPLGARFGVATQAEAYVFLFHECKIKYEVSSPAVVMLDEVSSKGAQRALSVTLFLFAAFNHHHSNYLSCFVPCCLCSPHPFRACTCVSITPQSGTT